MYKKKECVAMLLAGGQGSRLYTLTEKTAKPAVPFGGKYRIIDIYLQTGLLVWPSFALEREDGCLVRLPATLQRTLFLQTYNPPYLQF